MAERGLKKHTSYRPCNWNGAQTDRPLGFLYAGSGSYVSNYNEAFGKPEGCICLPGNRVSIRICPVHGKDEE